MTEQEKQAALTEVQESLFNSVFVPAFVKLAADKGVNITNEAELEQAIRIATMVEADAMQKKASGNAGLFKQAADTLERKLSGVDPKQAEVAKFTKQAAALPEVRQAVAKAVQLSK
jgi:hypothetical protein